MPRCLTAIGLIAATALLAGCARSYTIDANEVRQRYGASAYQEPAPRATRQASARTRSNPAGGDASSDVTNGDATNGGVAGSVGQASSRRDTPERAEADDNDRVKQAINGICRGC
jgi:hypothetical protein